MAEYDLSLCVKLQHFMHGQSEDAHSEALEAARSMSICPLQKSQGFEQRAEDEV